LLLPEILTDCVEGEEMELLPIIPVVAVVVALARLLARFDNELSADERLGPELFYIDVERIM
jgi:hypothetical protein